MIFYTDIYSEMDKISGSGTKVARWKGRKERGIRRTRGERSRWHCGNGSLMTLRVMGLKGDAPSSTSDLMTRP